MQAVSDEARFWGAFGLYATATVVCRMNAWLLSFVRFFFCTIYLNTQRDELWNYFSESRLTCMLGLVEASWLFHYPLLCFLDGFHIAYQSNFLVASHSGTGFNSSTCKIKMIDDVHVYASFCKIFIDILAVSTVSKKDYNSLTKFILLLSGQHYFICYLCFHALRTLCILVDFLSSFWLKSWVWWVLCHLHMVSTLEFYCLFLCVTFI